MGSVSSRIGVLHKTGVQINNIGVQINGAALRALTAGYRHGRSNVLR
jgi:hypothetical protein